MLKIRSYSTKIPGLEPLTRETWNYTDILHIKVWRLSENLSHIDAQTPELFNKNSRTRTLNPRDLKVYRSIPHEGLKVPWKFEQPRCSNTRVIQQKFQDSNPQPQRLENCTGLFCIEAWMYSQNLSTVGRQIPNILTVKVSSLLGSNQQP